MSSDQRPLWQRIGVAILLAIGLFATIRLVYITISAGNVRPAETADQRRANVIKGMEAEKEQSRKAWIESGKPFLPGGFDVIWNRATGASSSPAEE